MLQVQSQALQSLQDQQGTIVNTLLPLLPLVQAIPLHIENARSHIKDLLAEIIIPHHARGLRTSFPSPDPSLSRKEKRKKGANTPEEIAPPAVTNKRIRTCTTFKKATLTNNETRATTPSNVQVTTGSSNGRFTTVEAKNEEIPACPAPPEKYTAPHSDDDKTSRSNYEHSNDQSLHAPISPSEQAQLVGLENLADGIDNDSVPTIVPPHPPLRAPSTPTNFSQATSHLSHPELQTLQPPPSCSDNIVAIPSPTISKDVASSTICARSAVSRSKLKSLTSASDQFCLSSKTTATPATSILTSDTKKARLIMERDHSPTSPIPKRSTPKAKVILSRPAMLPPHRVQQLPPLHQRGNIVRTNTQCPRLSSGMCPSSSSRGESLMRHPSFRDGRRYIPLDDDSDEHGNVSGSG